MNKAELVSAVADKTKITKAQAAAALDQFLNSVANALRSGDKVTLVGFGTFKAAPRAAREGKNPKTGEKIKIPATIVPRFTAGAGFKAKVATGKAKKVVKK